MNALRRCTLLVNPSRSGMRYRALLRVLRRTELGRVVVTRDRDHLARAVEDFLQEAGGGDAGCAGRSGGCACLLVYGGDGTIHHTLITLYRLSPQRTAAVRLGFLRGGSGNGYHDSYGVPRLLRAQLRTLARSLEWGLEVPVDLLRVESGGRVVYGQMAGVGFDAEVLKRRERSAEGKSPSPGILRYALSGAEALFDGAGDLRREWDIRLEGVKPEPGARGISVKDPGPEAPGAAGSCVERRVQAVQIEMAKREFYGNGFRICPGARPTGGTQDVYLFAPRSPLGVLAALPLLWTGNHRWINRLRGGSRPVERCQARVARVRAFGPFSYHVDGELMKSGGQEGSYSLEVSVVPRAVRFLVPRRLHRRLLPAAGRPAHQGGKPDR
ncbi:MAG: diacylglycerol/lipid kinase family protein [Spirochaetota bacterium]